MKYDFESRLDRLHHDASAVDMPTDYREQFARVKREEGFDVIPMWVADMNFPVAPAIIDAIQKRAGHPSFGYFFYSDEYYDSIIRWQKDHNKADVARENIGYENGVLGGVISVCNVLISKGDNILVHSPTYIGFTYALENNGYHLIQSPLIKTHNTWLMDYQDMEQKIIDNKIKLAIICSPHNPTGRVWEKEELLKAMEIFERHHVYVISDEIWSDILLDEHQHVPTQSVNEYARTHTAAFYAPSKTFNLAGLIGSYHIVYDPWLKERLDKEGSLSHYNNMNVLSMHALIGAYSKEGEIWASELKQVLSANATYACDFINTNLPEVQVIKPQGTYMLFVDCRNYCLNHHVSLDEVIERGWRYGVYWQDGRPFHDEYSIRVNLALPLERVKEAFDRLHKHVFI